jgi:phosphotransferase system HPr-like phosphotransfer protein
MTRKGEKLQLSLNSTEEREALEKVALAFGCTWGDKPNISALNQAIAQGKLKVYWSDEVPTVEIKSQDAKAAIAKIQSALSELAECL